MESTQEQQSAVKIFDGTDEIIFSETVNIYDNKLILKNILGFTLNFEFEKGDPKERQKDIEIKGEDKEANLIFSKKFRNTLGSGTVNKMQLVKFDDGKILLFSIYGSVIGSQNDALNVTISFYLRKI